MKMFWNGLKGCLAVPMGGACHAGCDQGWDRDNQSLGVGKKCWLASTCCIRRRVEADTNCPSITHGFWDPKEEGEISDDLRPSWEDDATSGMAVALESWSRGPRSESPKLDRKKKISS